MYKNYTKAAHRKHNLSLSELKILVEKINFKIPSVLRGKTRRST